MTHENQRFIKILIYLYFLKIYFKIAYFMHSFCEKISVFMPFLAKMIGHLLLKFEKTHMYYYNLWII